MDAFILTFNAIAPVFLMILLGYGMKLVKLVSEDFVTVSMKLVFKVFLPILLFQKVAHIDLATSITLDDLWLMGYSVVALLLAAGLASLAGHYILRLGYNHRGFVKGAFIQGAFRTNYAIISYPILLGMFGDAVVLKLALVTVISIPIFNIISIIALTPEKSHDIKTYMALLKNIISNPLIIGIVLGFFSAVLNLTYPRVIEAFITSSATLATPLALVSLGIFFRFDHFRETLKLTLIATGIKNLLLPFVFSAIAYWIGLSPMNIVIITILVGGPTAVSSFAMSKEMDGDAVLSGNIIIMTTLICSFTLMLFLTFWVSVLGLA
jgi:predicted permease